MSNEDINTTLRFTADVSDMQSALREAQRSIKLTNAEFKAATSGMDKWNDTADGLTAKMKQLDNTLTAQKRVLDVLEYQYEQIAKEQGESSAAAENMRIRILNQKAAIANTEKSLRKYSNDLENLDKEARDAGDGIKKSSDDIEKFSDETKNADKNADSLTSTLAGLAKRGLLAVATATTALVTGMLGLAESTREYREDINKLQTAYQSAGHTAETATEMYKAFYSVLGEEDRSVEAVAHLAKLTDNQEELSKWTDICAGVWGTFGDSLPIEGLTEASNETAKTGKVTGVLADALNWAGISEDEFNKKLSKLNKEEERARLITETLSKEYQKASDTYRELNGDIIDAQLAQSNLTDALAGVGKAAEPVMTVLKNMGATILKEVTPHVEKLAGAFTNIFKNMNTGDGGGLIEGLINQIKTGAPKLINAGGELIANISNGFRDNFPQFLQNGLEMLERLADYLIENVPKLITVGGEFIKNIVAGLMASLPVLIEKAPTIITKFASVINDNAPKLLKLGWELIKQIAQGVIEAVPTLIAEFPKILTAILETWMAFGWVNLGKQGVKLLSNGIKGAIGYAKTAGTTVWNTIVNIIKKLPSKLLELGKTGVKSMGTGITGAVSWVKTAATTVFNTIWGSLSGLPARLLELGANSVKNLGNAISNGVSAVKTASTNVFNTVINALKSLPDDVLRIGKNALQNLSNAISNGISSVRTAAGKIYDSIFNTFKNLPSTMITIGSEIVNGIWSGISSGWSWLTNKVSNLANSLFTAAKNALGIKSPSKKFAWIGEMSAEGFGVGFTDTMKSVQSGMANTLNGLTVGGGSSYTPQLAGATGGGGVVNNFYQYNNSPKALSRYEIYRQTKNLLNTKR